MSFLGFFLWGMMTTLDLIYFLPERSINDDRLSLVRAACARAIRPMVRLALSLGLKYHHLDDLLRELLLEEARQSLQGTGRRPNVSHLAVVTGLNRKQINSRLRAAVDPLPATEQSAAARTLTQWLQLTREHPQWKHLPIAASASQAPSLEALARQASRADVHHRAVLNELCRLGLCREVDDHVDLLADGFVASGDLQTTLAFLGDNLRDHASAAVANTLAGKPMFLERAVFADGLRTADCEAVQQLVRERWLSLHHELVDALGSRAEANGDRGTERLRMGIYVYAEPVRKAGAQ
jgi:hypothetical protein